MKANETTKSQITRSQFLRGGSCLAAGAILGGVTGPECARCEEQKRPPAKSSAESREQGISKYPAMTLRPYQLLCVVCSLGEDPTGTKNKKTKAILDKVGRHPDMAVTLKCNMGKMFGFQKSGPAEDTAEGADFNKRRDLEILLQLNEPPGVTLSARILFNRLLNKISTVRGICDCGGATSDAWKGCPKAKSGFYEKAREIQRALVVKSCGERAKSAAYEEARKKGIAVLIPPRSVEELDKGKKESLAAMYRAKSTGIAVRPHTLLCAVCQYGGGTRPPFDSDNLPELIQLILKEPDTLITLSEDAPWTICGPCAGWSPELKTCGGHVNGSAELTNHVRDLRTVRLLDLTLGCTLKAGRLFRRIFERIPSTVAVCRFESPAHSVWNDSCGDRQVNNPTYEKGRKELMKELG